MIGTADFEFYMAARDTRGPYISSPSLGQLLLSIHPFISAVAQCLLVLLNWPNLTSSLYTNLQHQSSLHTIKTSNKLSKTVWLISCSKTRSAKATARKYPHHVWKDFGLPSHSISDWVAQCVVAFIHALNKLSRITEKFFTARHPQTDSQTEQANQEIEVFLCAFINT